MNDKPPLLLHTTVQDESGQVVEVHERLRAFQAHEPLPTHFRLQDGRAAVVLNVTMDLLPPNLLSQTITVRLP